jgi:Tol biopolymer transport system component
MRADQTPADQAPPAPAVASGALVYTSEGDIYVADPDGANVVAITDIGAIDDECPGDIGYDGVSWSPDGRYIASMISECPGVDTVTTVVIMDPSGNVTARFPTQGRWIAWSPDSTRVAGWDEYARSIGIYGIDGRRQTQIALPPGWKPGDLGELAWVPGGASLIVDQFEVPLDGGTPRELPFPVVRPVAYSPDGSQVAYATRHALTVARPDGSEPREVFGGESYGETWSPTGELIAVAADAPGDPSALNQLHVVDVATGSSTLLFEGERRTSCVVIGFSPEGDRILFMRLGGANEVDPGSLWSVGVDGSDARLVVAGTIDGAWRST